ncbi:lymphoid enhancer-binding factor 1-like isoform X2 [Phyllopteryx taeniolatus]|uniref:lymphoid enhancer-binding factor 1-like isoform X2 n=1 Tax=Phyllopteryx taeniolatus TaxID=161469 RepID=UPI002AD4808B|nr:lymphoid enhancer-binding factor 1-like isoform X2 [Phyllopteryx taeniolatus]
MSFLAHPHRGDMLMLCFPNRRTRNTSGPEEERPYIKKPPNAFMVFMKERRPNLKTFDSVAVNKILGKMWKSLTPAEQLPFFQESERLSLMHASVHPDWTCRDTDSLDLGSLCHLSSASMNGPTGTSRPFWNWESQIWRPPARQHGACMMGPRRT